MRMHPLKNSMGPPGPMAGPWWAVPRRHLRGDVDFAIAVVQNNPEAPLSRIKFEVRTSFRAWLAGKSTN